MNAPYRRRHPRYCLRLEVNLIPKGGDPIACSVRDFCLDGMFVQIDEQAAKTHRAVIDRLRLNEGLALEYVAPSNKRFNIPSRIAHIAGLGLGLQFIRPSDRVLEGLLQTATQQREPDQHLLPLAGGQRISSKEDLLPLIKDLLEGFAISLFHDFCEATVDKLFERAGKASSNVEQGQMFEAMDVVNKSRDGSFHEVWAGMAGQFEAFVDNRSFLGAPQRAAVSGELSLVEHDEFQNWLALTGVVSKLESRYDDPIYAMEKRLEHLVERPLRHGQNPLAPAAICRFFQELIAGFDVADKPRKLIQEAFQQTVEVMIDNFYTTVNELCIAYDILPNVEREMHLIKEASSQSVSKTKASQASPETAPETESAPTLQSVPATAHPAASGPFTLPAGAAPTGAGKPALYPPMAGALSLLALDREMQSGPAGAMAAPRAGGTAAPISFSNNEILSALDNVSHQLQDVRARRNEGYSLLEQLRSSLAQLPGAEAEKAIDPQASRSLEVVDGLMGSIRRDHISSEWSKSNLDQLEIPLAKSSLLDSQLLMEEGGAAAQLINRLDQVGGFIGEQAGPENQQLRTDVAQIVGEVAKNAGEDNEAYASALNQLDNLYDKVRRDYELNVSKVRKESEEKYRLEQKRRELLEILDEHIGNQRIPLIVTRILDAGWKNLLLRTYVREGRQGKSFRAYFEIINQLLAILSDDDKWISEKRWPGGTVVELVRRGLSQVPLGSDELNALMDLLEPQIQMALVEPASITTALVPSLTERLNKEQQVSLRRTQGEGLDEARWAAARDSVQSMDEGDVLSIVEADGRTGQHKLIWSSQDGRQYVFVDGEGSKSHEFRLDELAGKVLAEEVSIVEGLDVPLMDRASYSMLMSIHNKLLHNTNFDALTGLMNRRSFELSLNRVLEKARIDKSKSLICYFDMDRFNVVNNACGHEAGDQLLCDIAETLRNRFPECEVISRAGDDEFGIIMEDTSRTEGLQKVKALQEAFREQRFKCELQEFTVSASFGLVEISPLTESVRSLMSAIDSAYFTAKEGGRDRIEIYHQDNEAILRHDDMLSWVGRISRLFEGNHIQLRAQRIQSLSEVGEAYAHYEILLNVRDGEGQPISNEHFIQAAELYNRIIDIDRWVVTHALDWLEALFNAGSKVPVISINLSGRSLNNKAFMDDMTGLIKRCSVPAQHLCFEVTETAAIGNLGQATHFIKRIKALGCQFSLDDFGTGMSSYSYLKALPVDFLKIDGSFVKNIATDLNDQAVVKSINEIGHAMGKRTVAEYVENESILALLRKLGVDFAQGYVIEKPVLLSELQLN